MSQYVLFPEMAVNAKLQAWILLQEISCNADKVKRWNI